jgi:hypothetical protein
MISVQSAFHSMCHEITYNLVLKITSLKVFEIKIKLPKLAIFGYILGTFTAFEMPKVCGLRMHTYVYICRHIYMA